MSHVNWITALTAFAGVAISMSCTAGGMTKGQSEVQDYETPPGTVGLFSLEHYTADQADSFPHLIGNWYASGGDYRYMGGINSALVDDMIASGPPPNRLLIINSPGGENAAAIRLGMWLRRNGIAVRVPFSCVSACAQFVFVGAVSRSLDTGAWVACHQNTISNATILRSRRALSSFEVDELDDALALYKAAGVNEEFALACGAAAEPVCIVSRQAGLTDLDGLPVEALRSQSFWIPERSQLSEFGISIEGAGLERASSLHDWDGDLQSGRYRFGSSAHTDFAILSELPTCAE